MNSTPNAAAARFFGRRPPWRKRTDLDAQSTFIISGGMRYAGDASLARNTSPTTSTTISNSRSRGSNGSTRCTPNHIKSITLL
ncbi:unnamed protein product, partial [Iphiclides podalirius]